MNPARLFWNLVGVFKKHALIAERRALTKTESIHVEKILQEALDVQHKIRSSTIPSLPCELVACIVCNMCSSKVNMWWYDNISRIVALCENDAMYTKVFEEVHKESRCSYYERLQKIKKYFPIWTENECNRLHPSQNVAFFVKMKKDTNLPLEYNMESEHDHDGTLLLYISEANKASRLLSQQTIVEIAQYKEISVHLCTLYFKKSTWSHNDNDTMKLLLLSRPIWLVQRKPTSTFSVSI